jgi:hypothetical protein
MKNKASNKRPKTMRKKRKFREHLPTEKVPTNQNMKNPENILKI